MIRTVIALATLLALTTSSPVATAKTTLKMGTLAPERSPWGEVFRAWSKAVRKKTSGEVDIVWIWNGASGPETTAVGKVKTGQLAGAAVTATGLSTIHKPIVALQLPGAFDSWGDLDRARTKLAPEFDAALAGKGIVMGGWGDVGVGRIFSRDLEVRTPGDLRGHTPGYARASIVAPKVFEAIGGVTARPGTAGEVLGLLASGSIDVLISSPLATEQLQWASRLTHMNALPVGYGVGGIVLGERALAQLPADQRAIVERTSRLAGKAITKRIRRADDEAFGRLRRRLKVHEPTKAEAASWKRVFERACKKVKSSMPGDVWSRIGAC